MFKTLLRLLRSEGGYISAAMAIGSMIMNGVMGSKKQKALNKKFQQSGEEKNLANATTALFPARQGAYDWLQGQKDTLGEGLAAAKQGGLFGAIQDAFNPNPTTTELQGVTGQARQQMNQLRNMGVKGGQLRSQMLDVNQNAAKNRLALMENARQQAAARGFNIFQAMSPSQQSENAATGQALNYENLINNNWTNLAKMGMERNLAQAGVMAKDANQSGQGGGGLLGGLLGGMGGGGGGGLFGGLTTSAGGFGSFFPSSWQPGGGMAGAGTWAPWTTTDYGNLNPGQLSY